MESITCNPFCRLRFLLETSNAKRGLRLSLVGPGATRRALLRSDLSSAESCMGLNAISEFGQRDPEVTRITRNAARVQRQALMLTLVAKTQGELNQDVDLKERRTSLRLRSLELGSGPRLGKRQQSLRNIAAFAGRAYWQWISESLPRCWPSKEGGDSI